MHDGDVVALGFCGSSSGEARAEGEPLRVAPADARWHSGAMAANEPVGLCVHLAFDAQTRRWYVAASDVPGLRLEADDPAALIRRIEQAAPELIELNAEEVSRRFGIRPGDAVRLTPVFDSPIELAA